MTVTTHVRVVEPTPVKPIFDYARRLLGAEKAAFEQSKHWALNNLVYANSIDQGYAASLWVSYGPDGPLDTDPCEDLEEGLRPGQEHPPRRSIQISFDTAPLNYYPDNGASPSDLHAWLIREIGQWLSDRNLTWWWYQIGVWTKGPAARSWLGDADRGALSHTAESGVQS
jgi:hypothetical protein